MTTLAPPVLRQPLAPLACSILANSDGDFEHDRSQAQAPNGHESANPLGTPSPRASLTLQRPAIRISIPSSTFAAYSPGPWTQHSPSLETYQSGSMRVNVHSPTPGSSSSSHNSEGDRYRTSSRRGDATPSSPSKSPLRRLFSPTSETPPPDPVPELWQAARYLLATFTNPSRRETLCTSCAVGLQVLCGICIIWFAVSWLRTYSFEVARMDLITVLRYMLLVLGPLSLWCLPALSALSALLAWPHMSFPDPAHAPAGAPHPDADSPISFRVPHKLQPRSFDTASSSDAYTIAAASEELLHDDATPRFGFTVVADPQHDVRDGAALPPPSSPLPLTPKVIADACIEGAHRVAETLTGRASSDLRRPLLPATAKPRNPTAPARGGGCLARTAAILMLWLRHEAYLAVLCALAGYGTLAFALFDRDVLTRLAGVIIVMYPTPQLQTMTRRGSMYMFGLYSILLVCGCLCSLLSLWCTTLLQRHRGRGMR